MPVMTKHCPPGPTRTFFWNPKPPGFSRVAPKSPPSSTDLGAHLGPFMTNQPPVRNPDHPAAKVYHLSLIFHAHARPWWIQKDSLIHRPWVRRSMCVPDPSRPKTSWTQPTLGAPKRSSSLGARVRPKDLAFYWQWTSSRILPHIKLFVVTFAPSGGSEL